MRRLLTLLLALACALPAQAQLLPPLPGGSLVVTLTSPANGATVSGTIPINASVGIVGTLTVSRVDFYVDGSLIGSDTGSPYSVSWNTRNSGNGSHTLRAVAQDILGVRWNSNTVTVTVANDLTRPAVTINQAAGQPDPASGAPIQFTVVFSEPVSGFTGSDVSVGGTAAGSKTVQVSGGPSTYNAAVSGMTGSGTVTAAIAAGVASDAAGNTNTASTSTDNTVTFNAPDTTPPTVSITSPANGATVSGTINVTASASDNVGVTSVQFRLDGVNAGAPDTSAPYSIPWNTATVANGTHTLTAVARDAAGNTRTSAPVSVTVSNGPPPDTTPPTVSITSPANGATVSGTINVTASASDNVGVAGVQFQLDGVNAGAPDTSAPYAIAWNTTGASDGTHTITAIAQDTAGNTRTSSLVTVTVSNAPPADTTPPTVSITAPANGATVSGTINVTASASDNVGVAGVQFQLDGVNAGAPDTSAPYSIPWDTTTASNGTHTLTAIAQDTAGNQTVSAPVTVTVANNGGGTGAVRFEEDHASVVAAPAEAWARRGAETAAFSGGTAGSASAAGATISFGFNGTSVSWIGLKCSACGIATVSIDGGAPVTVDTAGTAAPGTPGLASAPVFSAPGLAAGDHSLVITVTGNTTSGGAHVIVDAFDVEGGVSVPSRIEETGSGVSVTGAWSLRGAETASFSGGSAGSADAAGAALTLDFSGTAVTWIGLKCSACGIANVSLDGVAQGAVDTAGAAAPGSPGLASEPVFSALELARGAHRLVITVTGTTNTGGAHVIVDAFDVTP